MKTISIERYRELLAAQGVDDPLDYAVKCPACGTVQSRRDYASAGAAPDAIASMFGFNCIGRFTGRGGDPTPGGNDGQCCNWTLGGLLSIHTMEVVQGTQQRFPVFEPATPEEAQAHARKLRGAG